MSLFDTLKAKADANGDGKIDKNDLEGMKDGTNNEHIDKLKAMADRNGDGKLSVEDAKNIDLGSLASDAKSKLGGMFGGK